jgi:hypothetical protein
VNILGSMTAVRSSPLPWPSWRCYTASRCTPYGMQRLIKQ